MKAGTTTLHAMLERHPDVFMCSPKEPTHFVDGDEIRSVSRRAWEAGFWNAPDRYLRLFETAGAARYRGDASTAYAKLPRIGGVAGRIADFSPGSRIIYLLRDPIERTISHYLHAVRWNGEWRPPELAVRAEPHYLEVSHYAMQLRPYLDAFGPERVFVLTLEALRDDPHGQLARLVEWLALPAIEREEGPTQKNKTSATIVRRRGPRIVHRVRQSSRLSPLRRFVPSPVKRGAAALFDVPIGRGDRAFRSLEDQIRAQCLDETAELSDLLDRGFSEWTTLAGGVTVEG